MDLPTVDEGRQGAHLVFVCHANHRRSPMMELLLRAELDSAAGGAAPLRVSSAGTHARPGTPAHPYAVRALAEHGVDATGWVATRLDAEAVEQADLILTADAQQRRDVVAMSGAAAARTFTFLDFSAWLAAVPAPETGGGIPELLMRAAAGRARLGHHHLERELPDPMGRSLRHFRRCRQRVEEALVPLLHAGQP